MVTIEKCYEETGYDASVCGMFYAATNVQRVKPRLPFSGGSNYNKVLFLVQGSSVQTLLQVFFIKENSPPLPPCSPYNYVPTGIGTRARQGSTEMTGLVAVASRRRSRPPQQNDDKNSKKTNWKMTNWKMRSQKMKSLYLDLKRRKQ